ncbi:MAG: DUF4231 domain-containing protein, partial [Chloroflexi bacterium]|nr:DUF4231 domain-containing protein [Chloroflexota bacterium]
ATRRQIAVDRIQQLIASCEARAARAWRNYYVFQGLTVGLAAITPCLIILAKESPGNGLLNWLQLFFPALAAVAAGLGHIFRWREDAVRNTSLAEGIRSQLWRYQTRAGEFGILAMDDGRALDLLVVQVDELNLKSVARWSVAQLTDAASSTEHAKPAPAN